MSYTSKADAKQNAEVNLEIDSAKLIRKIEAEISLWNGKSSIVVAVNESDISIGQAVVEKYRQQGWVASYRKGPTSAKHWIITLS